jgi:hypothetical protein
LVLQRVSQLKISKLLQISHYQINHANPKCQNPYCNLQLLSTKKMCLLIYLGDNAFTS